MKIGGSLYFDYQATCPVDPRVLAEMAPFWHEMAGNPHSSQHSVGWRADKDVKQAQKRIAALIGADTNEIVFTSGATEANNLVILGIAARRTAAERKRILVSSIEHKCVLAAAHAAAARWGFQVEVIPVTRGGELDLEALTDLMNEKVLLVSVMAVNNEVGSIQDVVAVSKLAHQHGALFHCDAAQAPPATDLQDLSAHADLISLSGHKMYAPQGIGALRISHALQNDIEPLIHGGGQQAGLRSGTIPLPLAVGLGKAAELYMGSEPTCEKSRVQKLRNRFVEALEREIPGLQLNGPNLDHRHPGNANLRFPLISGEDLLQVLQPRLAASTGSACTSGIPEPSHVLRAMGLSGEEAEGSIRFSFGRFTEDKDLDEGIALVPWAYRSLTSD